MSYLNELWLTVAWPSLELESDGGQTHRPLSSLLSSSKSLIKLSVEDSSIPSVFWPGIHSVLLTISNQPPREVFKPGWSHCCQFLLQCDPFLILIPLTHFVHGYEGLLCLVRESCSLPTFGQLFTAAWFNAVELSSQHLFGWMPQPQKEESFLFYFALLSQHTIWYIDSMLFSDTFQVRLYICVIFLTMRIDLEYG